MRRFALMYRTAAILSAMILSLDVYEIPYTQM